MTYLLPSKITKMADGSQGNAQNPTDLETNEGDSNDVEEADEVHYIRFVCSGLFLLLLVSRLKL